MGVAHQELASDRRRQAQLERNAVINAEGEGLHNSPTAACAALPCTRTEVEQFAVRRSLLIYNLLYAGLNAQRSGSQSTLLR